MEDEHGRWTSIRRRKEEIVNVRREMAQRGGPVGRAVGWIGNLLANAWFFLVLLLAHAGWIVANAGAVPGLEPWDPPPFTFLATIASVEAPLIALLILMAQARNARIDEIREEMKLQIDLYMEHQTSAVLQMLSTLQEQLGIETADDGGFDVLAEPLDPERLMEEVRRDVQEGEEGPRAAGDERDDRHGGRPGGDQAE